MRSGRADEFVKTYFKVSQRDTVLGIMSLAQEEIP